MSEEQPVVAEERVKARNRKTNGNHAVHLTPDQIMTVKRVLSDVWVFRQVHPLPVERDMDEEKRKKQVAEEAEKQASLLEVCDIFHHAYQQYCP